MAPMYRTWPIPFLLLSFACGGGDSNSSSSGTSGNGGPGTGTATATGATSSSSTGATATSTSTTSTATTSGTTATTTGGATYDCDNPGPGWLFCEDFEDGDGDFDTWFSLSDFIDGVGLSDRGRVDLSSAQKRSGAWSAIMPASADSGYRGASLDWYACDGEMKTNCPLRSFDELYFRAYVRFQEDHQYVHHFLSIAGSQPDEFWYLGTAGCLPNGELAMGTTVDFTSPEHESFFYQYHPDMNCDTNCGNYADVDAICQECASKGLPTCDQQQQCCWGNNLFPDTPVIFPTGEWFCLELRMKANDVGSTNGEVSYWFNDVLAHEVGGFEFRKVPELALNRVRLQHYITQEDAKGFSNVVWFDDVVVSTERIGCN